MSIILFSGPECCLCDLAKAQLAQLQVSYQTIDVKQQSEYFHRYGARIPVVYRQDDQGELGWPFEVEQLAEFLS